VPDLAGKNERDQAGVRVANEDERAVFTGATQQFMEFDGLVTRIARLRPTLAPARSGPIIGARSCGPRNFRLNSVPLLQRIHKTSV